MALSRQDRRLRIKRRIRKVVNGTPEQPRLSVFRSNKQIYAQIVDDVNGVTIAAASSMNKDIVAKTGITRIEQATLVGDLIAKVALSKGISTICFDRNGYLYHGRVKALADAARNGGLKF